MLEKLAEFVFLTGFANLELTKVIMIIIACC
jgi:hypothetical protein